MALLKNVLVTEIRKINDELFPSFEGWPASEQEASQRWAQAIATYVLTIVPVSATIALAKANMESEAPLSPTGFDSFASGLAQGMLGFTATPPPSPINLLPVFPIGLAGGSAEVCANAIANVIDAWFKTGIAVNQGSGVSSNWS